jgi:hypothetical protein
MCNLVMPNSAAARTLPGTDSTATEQAALLQGTTDEFGEAVRMT